MAMHKQAFERRQGSEGPMSRGTEAADCGTLLTVTIDQIVSAIRALPVLERLRVIEIVAHEAASDVPAALAESAPTRSVTLAEQNGLLVVDSDAFVAADAFDHRLDREVRTDRIWGGGS
ncbi:MAG TPA: hypothetical protein VE093_06735 [Polyangiaceae bacterium]|jgi:hypothetical protein|nr:hypothetical protein [Polyangiaceae bacterium]